MKNLKYVKLFVIIKKMIYFHNKNIKIKKELLQNITEPRRTLYGNIRHKFEDIIIIGLCTLICVDEDFSDMETFGKKRK